MRGLCQEMDAYQRKYHQYNVNITYSSRLALRMYFAAKKFYSIVRDNVSRRSVINCCLYILLQYSSNSFWISCHCFVNNSEMSFDQQFFLIDHCFCQCFRDVFRLTIQQYQDWFLDALAFWLQTFRSECLNRIERALEIDKDVSTCT